MARETESTMKWKLDIKDLKANIADAKRQISLANAEFKQATAGAKNWSGSLTGVEAKVKQLSTRLKSQKTVLSELEKEYKITADATGENSTESQKLAVQIENQKAAIASTERQLGDYADKANEMRQAQQQAQSPMNQLNSKIQEQEKQLASLKTAYQNAVLEYGKNSSEARSLAGQIDSLSSELAENKGRMQEASNAADSYDNSLESAHGGVEAFNVALGNMIANFIQSAISKMQELVTQTIEVGSNFESSMSKVQALSGASGKDLEMLTETAKHYGETTQFSATQASDALGYMALAGWDANQSCDALGGVLDLAAASGMDLAQASDMVTDYLSAFGLQAKDSSMFADMLAYAQANSNTTTEQLGEAYKNCAANMNAMGQDAQTTTAFLATLANQGLKGSEAGTALNAVMRDMTAHMKDGAIAIGDTSVQVMDANGNYRDLSDIMKDVENATSGMGDAEKAAALQSTFTSDSIKGLNLILNGGVDNTNKFEEALRKSDGTAKKTAKTMNDNLGGDLTSLGSKFEGLQISLYEKFEPALRAIVQAASGFLDVLGEMAPLFEALSPFILAAATAFGALAVKLAISSLISGVTKGFAMLNEVMAANPIVLVIGAIAGLIAGFIYLYKTNEDFRKGVDESWKVIKDTVIGAATVIKDFVVGAWNAISSTTSSIWNGIKDLVTGVWNGINSIVTTVVSTIQNIITSGWTTIGNTTSSIWNGIKNIISSAWDGIKSTVSSVVNGVKSIISNAWNGIKSTTQNMWNGIKNAITSPIQSAKSTVQGVVNSIRSIVSGIFNGIKPRLNLSLPHVSVNGGQAPWGIGGKGRLPSFGVTWNARGGVFERGARLLTGVGEDGAEAVVPLENNIKWIRKVAQQMIEALNETGLKQSINGITSGVNGVVASMNGTSSTKQNVVFNQIINSPSPVDRLTLYRQTNSLLFTAKVGLKNV